ncbi:MAG: fimbria/pilus outer membrane usher protein, partial [Vulcanimicrobiaceae bacterium]
GARTGLSLAATLRSSAYRDPTAVTPFAPPTASLEAEGSLRVDARTTLSLGASEQRFPDFPSDRTVSLAMNRALGDGALFASLGISRLGTLPGQTLASLSYVASLGPRSSLAVQNQLGSNVQNALDFRNNAPSSDAGFGYDLHLASGEGASDALSAVEHAPFADFNGTVQQSGSSTLGSVSLGGAIAHVGGHSFLARPIGDGFALVETGVPGTPVTLDGRLVGTSDGNGNLVVPSLSSYAANHLAIDPNALPLDVQALRAAENVAPGSRGGAVVVLRTRTIRYVIGTVRIARGGRTLVPSDGMLTLARGGAVPVRARLDGEGGFYLENLAPGRYETTVRASDGVCRFSLSIPAARAIATDLGTLTCIAAS